MQTSEQHLGKKGEEIATSYLRKKGFNILRQNFRIGRAEIDIIAETIDATVFVEVKSRSSLAYGYPECFVSKKQQKILIKAADTYVFKQQPTKPIRFDIVAIIITKNATEITHFEDAFWPTW